MSKGEAIATKEVPTQWYNRVKKTRREQESLYNRYSDKPWLVSVNRKCGKEMIEGKPAHVLEVGVTDKSNISVEIPTEVNGIEVSVQEQTPPEPQSCDDACDCNTYTYYEGGGMGDTEEQDGTLHAHSGCIIAEYPNYSNPGLLTCAHGMGNCGDSIKNHEVRAGADSGLLVGYVDEGAGI